ncbi:MAG TPA: hypothetical protein VJ723_01285, partial [Candidatus Angelobacter sp.]|nr:hypothetical protein [Candidatus Angelobacter sp.]
MEYDATERQLVARRTFKRLSGNIGAKPRNFMILNGLYQDKSARQGTLPLSANISGALRKPAIGNPRLAGT